MVSKCPVCGKEFDALRAQKYCSDECYLAARSAREHLLVEKVCPYCKKVFVPDNTGVQIYCSLRCREDAHNKQRRKGMAEARKCRYCGKEFVAHRHDSWWCSKDCYFKDRFERTNPIVAKTCPCGKTFEVRSTNVRQQYCSRECYDNFTKSRRDKAHKDKIRFSGHREDVLKRDGHKCTVCGSTENLAVHHKDHSGQKVKHNDNPDNLITICDSCHSKIHAPITWQTTLAHKRTPRITVTCQHCSKEFQTTQWRIDSGRGKFCSKECKNNSLRTAEKRICQHCGKEFEILLSRLARGRGDGKFCSVECRKAWGYNERWLNRDKADSPQQNLA